MRSKVALVLEGGGLRGIFTAVVIDCFLDNNIDFDYVVGVSAGSCNAFAYLAKARSFIKKCMLQEDKKNSFFGVQQMVESGKFVNLDKVFYDYTEQFDFDFETFNKTKVKWEFVATNMETGKAEYLYSSDVSKAQEIGRASCSLPILTSPVEIDGQLYLDGGVADSVPIKRALEKDYEKVVVVCTRRKGSYSKVKKSELPIMESLYSKYPNFIECVKRRTDLYKKQIDLCEQLEEKGNVVLIRPTLPEVSRLESDLEELRLSYFHGYSKTKEHINRLEKW